MFVVGLPYDLKGRETDATKKALDFIKSLKNKFPSIPLDTYDERYTLKCKRYNEMGKNKKFRQEKSNVDKISASIILQSYLTRKNMIYPITLYGDSVLREECKKIIKGEVDVINLSNDMFETMSKAMVLV